MYKKSQANFIKLFERFFKVYRMKSNVMTVSLILILVLSIGLVFAFQGGDGSSGNPYQIRNCTELQNMSSCLSCNYTLMNDIDCSETNTWNGGLGFNPIGNCSGGCFADSDDYPFEETFDGKNFTISNLYINRPLRDYVGLFGFISTSGSAIKNVGITNSDITGNNNVGGIAGITNYATVDNSYYSGQIMGNESSGGLVGYSMGVISNSYSTGSVLGGRYVGGLVGITFQPIDNSYSKSSITGDDYVGGLVGFCRDDVTDSFSTGDVNGNTRVGGLFGYTTINPSITNCFTTSQVNGTDSNYGGLVGTYNTGTFTNTYWYNTSSNINHTFGSGSTVAGINNTASLLYFYSCSNEPMASWTLTNWNCTGTTYPYLAWQTIPVQQQSSSGLSAFPFGDISSIILTIFMMISYLFLS